LRHLAALLALTRAKKLALDHRAVFVLQRLQLRKRVRDGKFVRVARVDSGDERINRVVEEFLVEPPHHELRDAFFNAIAPRGNEWLAQHSELGFEREQVRREKSQR